MILILSIINDKSTSDVIEWLLHCKIPFIRINEDSTIIPNQIVINNKNIEGIITISNNSHGVKSAIELSNIKVYWYRRGNLFPNPLFLKSSREFSPLNVFEKRMEDYISSNAQYIINHLFYYFDHLPGIGKFSNNQTNKLSNIIIAKEAGLDIAPTAIVTTKRMLVDFLKKHKKIITKGIFTNGWGHNNEYCVSCYTSEITENDIPEISDSFAPSLIQSCVEKYCELRVFYLDGTIKTAAIFSQIDPKTKLDFRFSNIEHPLRMNPYNLPNKVASAIHRFMKKISMSSGSLDFILTKENKIFFLEINPVGQFGFISEACNFNLEKIIAENLITKHERPCKKVYQK